MLDGTSPARSVVHADSLEPLYAGTWCQTLNIIVALTLTTPHCFHLTRSNSFARQAQKLVGFWTVATR